MQKTLSSAILLVLSVSLFAETPAASQAVSGDIYVGTSFEAGNEHRELDLSYETNDPRLGTNSGNRYSSLEDTERRDTRLLYGVKLDATVKPNHLLSFSLRGSHDWNQKTSSFTESVYDPQGILLSRINGTCLRPHETGNDMEAGIQYTYRMPRAGESLAIGYQYRWDNDIQDAEQRLNDVTGFTMFNTNRLSRHIAYQYHHVHLDYVCPIVKGHALEMGLIYDRRRMETHTLQLWDQNVHLDANYRHLMQYGAIYARYRLQVGPVRAMAGLEYRATKMQQRWLHDLIPTAVVNYQIDSVHALSARYAMLVIRPDYTHLDSTVIRNAFTQSFGNDALVGTHVHNTSLSYQMSLSGVSFSANVRYITAKDGLNALWMERNNVRIYTWGNEGIRHAVSFTPTIDARLCSVTRLHWDATVLWDERVAKAIQMSNANWGIRTTAKLEQTLPYSMSLILKGEYAFHNTLDLYSYSGHGGELGMDWRISFLKQHNLSLQLGYTCRFNPAIHITQGAYTGIEHCMPGVSHLASVCLSYRL